MMLKDGGFLIGGPYLFIYLFLITGSIGQFSSRPLESLEEFFSYGYGCFKKVGGFCLLSFSRFKGVGRSSVAEFQRFKGV